MPSIPRWCPQNSSSPASSLQSCVQHCSIGEIAENISCPGATSYPADRKGLETRDFRRHVAISGCWSLQRSKENRFRRIRSQSERFLRGNEHSLREGQTEPQEVTVAKSSSIRHCTSPIFHKSTQLIRRHRSIVNLAKQPFTASRNAFKCNVDKYLHH
jgi:hypothetical protein